MITQMRSVTTPYVPRKNNKPKKTKNLHSTVFFSINKLVNECENSI